jgi:peptide methionine sulfoxide reductase msrA/msrB
MRGVDMKRILMMAGTLLLLLTACSGTGDEDSNEDTAAMTTDASALQKATFAGGCFWCMEPPFEKLDGVKEVISGYTGGHKENPTYEEVSSGTTGHAEAVQITFDPSTIGYADLLDVFWQQMDPTDDGGSFVDRGSQYRSAIFYHNEEQKRLAEQSKRELEQSGKYDKPIVTQIVPYTKFWKAEDYHQDYYRRRTAQYKAYRSGSGRDQYINRIWGDEK